jgi:hypothetical protein
MNDARSVSDDAGHLLQMAVNGKNKYRILVPADAQKAIARKTIFVYNSIYIKIIFIDRSRP